MWETDIHAAGFLAREFGLDWRHRPHTEYPPDDPRGWPFPEPGIIVADFATTAAQSPTRGALILQPPAPIPVRSGDNQRHHRVPVVTPMSGMTSFSRDTPFGPRIQVVNEKTGHLIVLFGVNTHLNRDGMAVRRGQLLGWIEPDASLRLQYFRYGRLSDYQPLLDSSRDLLE